VTGNETVLDNDISNPENMLMQDPVRAPYTFRRSINNLKTPACNRPYLFLA
jgi:hypothetical protein